MVILVTIYFVMVPLVFYAAAKTGGMLESPWETPGPFMAGLFWPVAIPFILGTMLCREATGTRAEKRREREIIEAKHKVELAKLRAEETAQLERALR